MISSWWWKVPMIEWLSTSTYWTFLTRRHISRWHVSWSMSLMFVSRRTVDADASLLRFLLLPCQQWLQGSCKCTMVVFKLPPVGGTTEVHHPPSQTVYSPLISSSNSASFPFIFYCCWSQKPWGGATGTSNISHRLFISAPVFWG